MSDLQALNDIAMTPFQQVAGTVIRTDEPDYARKLDNAFAVLTGQQPRTPAEWDSHVLLMQGVGRALDAVHKAADKAETERKAETSEQRQAKIKAYYAKIGVVL